MTVVEYCQEEVSRQGHDITQLDGIQRTAWMLDGWVYALKESEKVRYPNVYDVIAIGQFVEPEKNRKGLRSCGVRVGSRVCPSPERVSGLLAKVFLDIVTQPPLDFYRAYEIVHPFVDGNGRVGKILLAWGSRSLLEPKFPPNDFWGTIIRNP